MKADLDKIIKVHKESGLKQKSLTEPPHNHTQPKHSSSGLEGH